MALTAVAFVLRFFSPIMSDFFAHPFDGAPISNCVRQTPVDAQGTLGTICGLAYPFQRGYAKSSGAPLEPPAGEVFDEVYFADFPHDDLKGINYFDDKPTGGKLILAAGQLGWGWFRAAFQGAHGDYRDLGFNTFGWRIMSCIIGTLVVPLMYLFALRLWPNRFFALAAGVLSCFDGMLFVQSRIAMLDIIVVFFLVLTYWLFLLHLSSRTRRGSVATMLLCGTALGLGVATKWSVLAALGTILLFIVMRPVLARLEILVRSGTGEWRLRRRDWRGLTIPGGVPVSAYAGLLVVALVAIPLFIYVTTWFPFFLRGQFHTLGDILAHDKAAYDFNAHLTATHPYGSPWFSWPFLYRPVAYYFQSQVLGTDQWTQRPLVAGMIDLGNPWIWWTSLPCLLAMPYFVLKHRSGAATLITIAFLAQYLPWSRISRVLFLYEMAAALPFMILALALVLAKVAETRVDLHYGSGHTLTLPLRGLAYAHLVVAVLFFVYFYPVWTALPLGENSYLGGFPGGKMWFPSWI